MRWRQKSKTTQSDAKSKSAFAEHGGMYWSFIRDEFPSAYGIDYGFMRKSINDDLSSYISFLQEGGVIIAGCERKDTPTKGGHILVIAAYDESTRKYLFLDSDGSTTSSNYGYTGTLSGWYSIDENLVVTGCHQRLQLGATTGYKRR